MLLIPLLLLLLLLLLLPLTAKTAAIDVAAVHLMLRNLCKLNEKTTLKNDLTKLVLMSLLGLVCLIKNW